MPTPLTGVATIASEALPDTEIRTAKVAAASGGFRLTRRNTFTGTAGDLTPINLAVGFRSDGPWRRRHRGGHFRASAATHAEDRRAGSGGTAGKALASSGPLPAVATTRPNVIRVITP